MALNYPTITNDFELDDIISSNLDDLLVKLQKQGFEDLTIDDFECDFLSRVEYLAIKSEKLYPEADLPANFGVQRGYNGGGIHSGLIQTEFDRLPKNRLNKAQRVLDLIEKTFWQILKDFDGVSEENEETVEAWESVRI